MDDKERVSSLSQSRSLAEMAEFWDTHDATDFDDETREADMTFDLDVRRHYVAIDPDLLNDLRQVATARGLSTESLINLWLQERLLTRETA